MYTNKVRDALKNAGLSYENIQWINLINDESSYLVFQKALEYIKNGNDPENGDNEEEYIKQIMKLDYNEKELMNNDEFLFTKELMEGDPSFNEVLIDYAWRMAQRIYKLKEGF